jgi:hypothetical protein
MILYFFIWWGTEHKRVRRGVVADVCGACRQITPFVVVDHFSRSHIYGAGIGAGTYLGASRDCWRCRRSFHFVETAYDDVLAISAATAPDAFDRLLRGTNKRLAGILDIGNRLRARHKDAPYRAAAGEGDEALVEALEHLEKLLLSGYDVQPFFEKLDTWEELTEDARSDLGQTLRAVLLGGAALPPAQ